MPRTKMLLALLGALLCTAHAASTVYNAELSGAKQHPSPISTAGRGKFELTIDGNNVAWALTISNTSRITAAHIHLGGPTTNGPVFILLLGDFGLSLTIDQVGTGVFRGKFTVAEATSAFRTSAPSTPKISSPTFMVDTFDTNGAYVNVHTADYPGGIIRGQIVPGPLSDAAEGPTVAYGFSADESSTAVSGAGAPSSEYKSSSAWAAWNQYAPGGRRLKM